MSEIRINHSSDLARLEADGLRLHIKQGAANHLLIEGIPAVTTKKEVVLGTLYSPLLTDATGKTVNPCIGNHQCWWIGNEVPCDATGRVMVEMIASDSEEDKGDGIKTIAGFSRVHADKRPYADYYEKIWTYINAIWHEARVLDPSCDPRSERILPAVIEAQSRSFRYPDMATTRAGIGAATAKLITERVAIIGIGGTGSYILDLIAKVPVAEIHIFDEDTFELHNAFRAPGAPKIEELTNPLKVDWFGNIYDRIHLGIKKHPYHITGENLQELSGFDFVFVAIDDAAARKTILQGLIKMGVSFIDVGLDIGLDKGYSLRGISRFTVGLPDFHSHVEEVISWENSERDEIYRNIQVADLNMLNASMAVGKWKRLRGFYADDVRENHSLYTTATQGLIKEDKKP